MGTTVVTDYGVTTFNTLVDGKAIYLLHIKTYENNVYPHTARWHIMFIGTYDQCIERIIMDSSCCEGGGLNNTRRTLNAVKYVDKWRKAFTRVTKIQYDHIPVKFSDQGFYSVPLKYVPYFEQVLNKNGVDISIDGSVYRIVLDLNNEKVLKSLLQIINDTTREKPSIWKVLHEMSAEPNRDQIMFDACVFNKTPTLVNLNQVLPGLMVYRFQPGGYVEYLLFAQGKNIFSEGKSFVFGCEWQLTQTMVAEFFPKIEVQYPASMSALYDQLIKLIKDAVDFPDTAKFVINKPDDNSCSWSQRNWLELCHEASLNHEKDDSYTVDPVSFGGNYCYQRQKNVQLMLH